jgi:Bax protein
LLLSLSLGLNAKQPVTLSKQCEAFLSEIGPEIDRANNRIRVRRAVMHRIHRQLFHSASLSPTGWSLVQHFGIRYNLLAEDCEYKEIPDKESLTSFLWELDKRMDLIPREIVLAQAILESGWGRSVSAQATYNYFGITSASAGKGYEVTRSKSRIYYLKQYDSRLDGILDYMHLLNTHSAYTSFRAIRQHERRKGLDNPVALLPGLIRWSERKTSYLAKLQLIIERYLPESAVESRQS